MFWDEAQKERKVNPVSTFYDWSNYKKEIEAKEYLSNKLSKTTDAKEIASIKKEIADLRLYSFEAWDSDAHEPIFHMPEQFILMEQTSCLKWYDPVNKWKVFSNEIISVRDEPLKMQSFTKGSKQINTLWEGNYSKEVWPTLKDLWGKFTRGMIALEWTELVEYYVNGSALKAWSEDIRLIETNKYKVKLDKVEELKNGSITFYVPRWVQWDEITEEEVSVAMGMIDFIKEYRA